MTSTFRTLANRVKQTDLADAIGVSTKTIQRWTQDGCPRNADKTYDLFAVLPWWRTLHERVAAEAASDEPNSPALEEGRRLRNELTRLELAKRQGELVDRAEVEVAWGQVLSALAQSLAGMPAAAASRLENRSAAEVSAVLAELIEDRLDDARAAMEDAANAD